MENLERRVKEQEEIIARLRAETANKAHEDDDNIYVDLSGAGGSRHQRRRRRRDDSDEEDAGEAALLQVFKKAKLNEFDGVKKTGEDLEAWIEELEDFFALREFSEEAKAKIAILQLRSVAKLWWKSYMQTRTLEGAVAWTEF